MTQIRGKETKQQIKKKLTGTQVISWNSFWHNGQRFVIVAQLSMQTKQNLKSEQRTITPRTKLAGQQSYFKDIEASIPMLAAIQNSSINYNIHAYPTSFTFSTQIVLQTTNKGLPLNQLYLTEGIQKDS